MVQKVLKENKKRNKLLRRVSKEVTVFDISIIKLISDLRDTLRSLGGVGIAAPQIGVSKRVIIVGRPGILDLSELIMINPKILDQSVETQPSKEACLSVPRHSGIIERHKNIYVQFQDKTGNMRKIIAEGFQACIIQHEIDHLNGVLFTDHLK